MPLPQEVEMLIGEMDPDNGHHISFSMFCRGIETYLISEFLSCHPFSYIHIHVLVIILQPLHFKKLKGSCFIRYMHVLECTGYSLKFSTLFLIGM